MISLESEHYIRLILLLIKGGTEVLKETVTSGLKKKNIGIDKILNDNRKEICSTKEISDIQRDILYPPPPHFSDISKWDISLLSYISLNVMDSVLTDMERKAVEKLNDMKNAIKSYSETAEIKITMYTHIMSELSMAISLLSLPMSEQNRAKVQSLVIRVTSDPLDIYAVVEELKRLERRDAFFECIQSSLEILHDKQDVDPRENVAENCEETRIWNNEVREKGTDTEDDRKELFSSDYGNNIQERETTGEMEKSLCDPFPNGRNNSQDHNVVLCSSVSQYSENVHGAVHKTKTLNEKEDRQTETKRNQDESNKMVFGQGYKEREFEKTAEIYAVNMSNSRLFQQGEETQKPYISESNQQLNESINSENVQATSDNENTHTARKSDADNEMINSGAEASQAFGQNNDGYDVDTVWQSTSMQNANQSHTVNDQSIQKENIPLSNQHEVCSALDE